jgi:broad specificity phosphatase PhoE
MNLKHMIKHLFFFRHGQTDWNAQGKIQGHQDIALNSAGIEQAHALGQQLQPLQIEFIASSDLLRARQTADIVATYGTPSILYTPELREIHYGTLQGNT